MLFNVRKILKEVLFNYKLQWILHFKGSILSMHWNPTFIKLGGWTGQSIYTCLCDEINNNLKFLSFLCDSSIGISTFNICYYSSKTVLEFIYHLNIFIILLFKIRCRPLFSLKLSTHMKIISIFIFLILYNILPYMKVILMFKCYI